MSDTENRGFQRRPNHLSSQEVTRRASGDVLRLTSEQIANMTPNKPTETKRINVTAEDVAKESAAVSATTVDDALAQAEEIAKATIRGTHRRVVGKSTPADKDELTQVNTAVGILARIKSIKESGPLTIDQLKAIAGEP